MTSMTDANHGSQLTRRVASMIRAWQAMTPLEREIFCNATGLIEHERAQAEFTRLSQLSVTSAQTYEDDVERLRGQLSIERESSSGLRGDVEALQRRLLVLERLAGGSGDDDEGSDSESDGGRDTGLDPAEPTAGGGNKHKIVATEEPAAAEEKEPAEQEAPARSPMDKLDETPAEGDQEAAESESTDQGAGEPESAEQPGGEPLADPEDFKDDFGSDDGVDEYDSVDQMAEDMEVPGGGTDWAAVAQAEAASDTAGEDDFTP